MARFRCDSCDYVYDENAGDPREGIPARHTVERGARRLGLPGLRECARRSTSSRAEWTTCGERILDAARQTTSERGWSADHGRTGPSRRCEPAERL